MYLCFTCLGKSNSLVETDKATGLMKARHGSHMITADGNIRAVPADCFVHPQTGHCLPIAGNVAFDPVTSRLVFVTDSATSKYYVEVLFFLKQWHLKFLKLKIL